MKEILQALKGIEDKYNVTIVYAVESGSRAWGFAAPTSDYDVRFIYVRNVFQHVSVLNDYPETIGYIDTGVINGLDLDMQGWDLKKACNLACKTNGSITEWMQSEIVYINLNNFKEKFTALLTHYLRPRSLFYHYASQALTIFERDIRDAPQPKIKKYLYAIRCVLAAHYILQHNAIPPLQITAFTDIAQFKKLKPTIDLLLEARKSSTQENEVLPSLPDINAQLNEFIFNIRWACPVDVNLLPINPNASKLKMENFYKEIVYLHDVPF